MKQSAGILMYRKNNTLEVFLVHPGGPFWKNKDNGAWSIPKGEFIDGEEEALTAAIREFKEETSFETNGPFLPLGSCVQKNNKTVYAWGCEGTIDAEKIQSNMIKIEWPPHSGKQIEIPEVDRGAWFSIEIAKSKINPDQIIFLDNLLNFLASHR